jgi:hypothetical protein
MFICLRDFRLPLPHSHNNEVFTNVVSSFYVHRMFLSRMLTCLFTDILYKKFAVLYETRKSITVLILNYPKPDEFNPLLLARLLLRNISMLSSIYYYVFVRSVSFIISSKAFIFSPVRTTCTTHFFLLDFITLCLRIR